MSGPTERPKRNRPISTPRATAPIRTMRYSAGVMLRPARPRSSARVGLPCTRRRWLSVSAAGRSKRSTSSRGVARGCAGLSGAGARSRRILSTLQKKMAMASAAGTAITTATSWLLIEPEPSRLEQRREGGLDRLQRDPFGRRQARAGRIRGLGARRLVVVVRLELVLERCVCQEPRYELGLAVRDHDREARSRRGR